MPTASAMPMTSRDCTSLLQMTISGMRVSRANCIQAVNDSARRFVGTRIASNRSWLAGRCDESRSLSCDPLCPGTQYGITLMSILAFSIRPLKQKRARVPESRAYGLAAEYLYPHQDHET